MSEKDKSLNDALAALKKAQHTEGFEPRNPEKNSKKSASHIAGISALISFWSKLTAGADMVWNGWLKPVTRFLSPFTKRIISFYRWSFKTFAYKRSGDERTLSRQKAGFTVLALAFITVAAPYALVRHIIPFVSRTIYDAGMLATMKEDTLYLGRAELINADRSVFQVMGCRDIDGCDGGDNTTYYRLRDNVILDIKYWTTRFEPYDPAEIAGAMVSELNDCTIKYYGRRVKAFGWYPYIVNASCAPVLGRD
jgi:hypothetical protein